MRFFFRAADFHNFFFQGWNFLSSSTALKVACPDDPRSHISPNQSPSTRATMTINGILVYLGFA